MDPLLRRGLRLELVALGRKVGTKRDFAPLLHIGQPGHDAVVLDPTPAFDHALRVALVGAALDLLDQRAPVGWLTRPGPLHLTDLDLRWHSATQAAQEMRGCAPGFYVLTRNSWTDARTGESQVWARPPYRRRRAA